MTDHSSPENADGKWIADLIRNEYDKSPDHYRMGDSWDDGAERIAAQIIERFGIRAQSTPEPVTYQLRFRRESGEWSEWQNVVSPWDGSRNPAWEYRPLYAAFSSPESQSEPGPECGGVR